MWGERVDLKVYGMLMFGSHCSRPYDYEYACLFKMR
jgi:hypothetical protein